MFKSARPATGMRFSRQTEGDMADVSSITRIRVFVTICIPLLLIYALVGLGTVFQQKRTFAKELELLEGNILEMEARLFESTLAGYLANSAILADIAGAELAQNKTPTAAYAQMFALFKAYALHHRIYDQIRYIDQSGMEKVRLNWDKEAGYWQTSIKNLQYKGQRPYFIKGMHLKSGEAHISGLDLNVENGRVERPFKPVLRIVLPVAPEKDRVSGVLVMNLLGQNLIKALVKAGRNTNGEIFLVNDRGHWLKGPSPELEWQFMTTDTFETITNRFPGLWQQMTETREGRYAATPGLFLFTSITPHSLLPESHPGIPKVDAEETWKIINFIPESRFSPPWMTPALSFLAAGAAMLAMLAWFSAGLMVRRARALQQLADKEKELITITDSVQDAIVMVDDIGRASFWNASAERMFGYEAREILGRDIHEFITPDLQRPLAAEGLETFALTGEGRFIGWLREVEAMRRDGSIFPAELNLKAIRIENRWWAVGVVRDISQRKKVEAELLALNRELEERVRQRTRRLEELVETIAKKERMVKLLGDVASTANTADSAEQALEITLSLIAGYTGWPLGHVYLPSKTDTPFLVSAPLWHVSDPERFRTFMATTERTKFKPGEGLPGRIYASGKACWIEDVTCDNNFPRAKILTDIQVRGAFGFPVLNATEVVAVLEFFSPSIEKPDQTILELVEAVGKQLGYVMERKRIEKAVEESERKFRGIFDQSSQLMGLLTTEGRVLQVNETALEMINKTQDAVMGQLFWETPLWRHSKDRARDIRKAVIQAAAGTFTRFETAYMNADGQIRDLDFSLKPIMDPSGHVRYLIPEGRDITERKQAVAEAKKLALVVEKTSTGVVITGKDGRVEWFNRGFEQISGFTLEEMQGKKPGRLLQGPGTDPATVARISRALKEEEGVQVELLNYRKSGQPYWVELDIQPIFSDEGDLVKYISIETDITERRDAEDALRQFKATLDQTHDAVFMFDPDSLRFIYVNQGAVLQLGYPREKLMEMTPLDIKPEFTKERFLEMVAPLRTGERQGIVFETVHAHKKGHHIPVEILLQLVREEKGPARFVAIVRDVTEQKRINLELQAARDAAEQAARAKGEFLANMSHEIRTPMNAIIGMAYLVGQTALTPRQKDYLDKIETSAKSLLGIINDILDFSKIDAGKLRIEKVTFDITEVISDIATLSASQMSEKGLELNIIIDDRISPLVIGDPVRVGQVFNNLLSNAVKFTEKGDIEIHIRLKERSAKTQVLECEVADTGIGMSPQQTARLFRKFSQADTAITRKYGGTGLGLAICRQLVRLMGGEIRVESQPGSGSRFIFTLPLGYQDGSRPMAAGKVLPLNLRNLKVLLMDDNPKTLDNLKKQLKSLTFKVTAHATCSLGIKEMEAALLEKEPFELVVMDYRNCRDEGVFKQERIWETLARLKIPAIVLVSMKDLMEAEALISKIHMLSILSKPVTPSNLFNVIVDAFGYRELKVEKSTTGTQAEPTGGVKVLNGARVLLVEDNRMNQQVAKELLEQAKIHVSIANDGQEALDMLERNLLYDLILMDVQMPRMDGITAAGKIREMGPRFRDLPIIAMTANAMVGDRQKSLDAGMDDHISKPVDPHKLYDCLIRWIAGNAVSEVSLPDKGRSGPDPALAGKLPTFDVSTALKQVGGNRSLYESLLDEFCRTHAGVVDRIRDHVGAHQREAAVREAHTAKGLCATIGAVDLHQAFKAVEAAVRKNTDNLASLLSDLETELNRTMAVISEALPLEDPSPSRKERRHRLERPGLTPPELLKRIRALLALTRANDMASEDTFIELRESLAAGYPRETEKVADALASLDFKLACTLLEEIRKQIDGRNDEE